MASSSIAQILQEGYVLATGRSASAATQAHFESLVTQGNGYGLVAQEVDLVIGQMAAVNGVIATLKTILLNGLGLSLTDAQAEAALALAPALGIDSWSKLFEYCINLQDSNGLTLDHRGEAGLAFNATLAGLDKTSLFSGSAVEAAVTNLVQNIGASTTSLTNGLAGLDALAAKLTATGIESSVASGYVVGATVFADANSDGMHNAGEFVTTTDAAGHFTLPRSAPAGTLVAWGGNDLLTGNPFRGALIAPAGATIVNPLTTMVQALLISGQATSVAQATAMVQQALGLPADVNLLSYDPLAVLASSTASDGDKATALDVQRIALQLVSLITQTSVVIDAVKGAGSSVSFAISALASALAVAAAPGGAGTLNLTDSATLAGVIAAAATNAGAPEVVADASSVAEVTSAGNASMAAASTITDLARAAVVSHGSAADALALGAADGSLDAAVAAFTGTNLDAAIDAAVPGFIAPGVPVEVPATTFAVIVDGGVVSFANAGTQLSVSEADGIWTFTSNGASAGTATVTEPVAGIEVPSSTTLFVSSVLASGKTFSGAGTTLVLASATGEDLTSFSATGVTGFVLESGQDYTLTAAQGAIGRIGIGGAAGTLTDAGTLTIRNTLSALGSGVANILRTNGADSVIATAAPGDISATVVTGIDVIVLAAGSYTMTAAQASLADGSTGTQIVTLTTLAAGTMDATIESFVLGNFANNVKLGAAAQDVSSAAGAATTLAIDGTAPTGTWALAHTGDTLVATTGANITGVNDGAATTAENLKLTGAITMTRDQHAALAITASGKSDEVTITTAGIVSPKAGVESYTVAQAGTPNTVSVSAAVAGVDLKGGTGKATVVVNSGVTATGDWSLSGTSDVLSAATGANISGVNDGAATTAETLNLVGAITMTQAQHQAFTSVTAPGTSDSITITNGGAITAGTGIDSYVLSAGGANTLAVLAGATAVTGSSNNATTVAVGSGTVSGNWALGHTADLITATNGASIAGVNAGGVTTAETLGITGTVSMTQAQHEAMAITVASIADVARIASGGAVTAKSTVSGYNVSSGGSNTLAVNAAQLGVNIAGAAGFATTVDAGGNALTGTWNLAHATADIIQVTNGAVLSGINAGGATTAELLEIAGGGTVTMTAAQHNALAITANGTETLTIAGGGTLTAKTGIENYKLQGGATDVTVVAGTTGVNLTGVNDGLGAVNVTIGSLAVNGSWNLAASSDRIIATDGADISGVNAGAATTAENLTLTGAITMTQVQHEALAITAASGSDAVIVTTGGAVTGRAGIESYTVSSGGANTLAINAGATGITGNAAHITTISIDGNTVSGTWALGNAADVLVAIDGADISGVNAGAATTAEHLSLTGAIAMTLAQHDALVIVAAGGSDAVTLTTGGAITSRAGIESYTLSSGGANNLTVNAGATGITGNAANITTVSIGGNTVSGTWALGNAADIIIATAGSNITGVNSGAATTAESLTLTGAITMTQAQHEALAIVAAGGSDAVIVSTGGAVTARAGVESYTVSSGGANNLTVNAGATGITSDAAHITTVSIGGKTVSGTWALGNAADVLIATGGADITGVNAGAATTAEHLSLTGAIAMTLAQYDALVIAAAGGSDAVTITTGGAVIGKAGIESYTLSSGGANNLTVNAGATGITGSAVNITTVSIGGNTASGTWALGNAADVLIAADGADITGVNAGAATTAENLTLTGAITMTQAQHEALAIAAASGSDAVIITTAGTVTGKAGIESYTVSSGGTNTLSVLAGATAVTGSSNNATTVAVGSGTVSGNWALGHTADLITATNGASIAGVNAGGVTTAETLGITGTVSMTQAQHEAMAITVASIADVARIASGGAVTAKSTVSGYNVSSGGSNTLAVNAAQLGVNIAGAAGFATTVDAGGNALTGTWNLAHATADIIQVTNGAVLSGINAGGATTAELLEIAGGGTVTMTAAQHNALAITANGTETLTIAGGGTLTAKTGIENYKLQGGATDVTVVAGTTGVNLTGVNDGLGAVNVTIGNLSVNGSWSLAASSDRIYATDGADISGVNAGAATTAENLTLTGAITMTQGQHAGLTISAAGSADRITITNSGTVTAQTAIETYVLNAGASLIVNAAKPNVNVTGAAGAASAVVLGAITAGGTWALGNANDSITVSNGANFAAVNGGAATTAERMTMDVDSTATMTAVQYNALNNANLIAPGSSEKIIFTTTLAGQVLNAVVENFTLFAANNTVNLGANGQSIDAQALTAGQLLSLAGGYSGKVTLGAGNLTSVATGAIEVTGGTGANTITTGDANDIVNAGDGADNITGGLGADTLNGGNGNDNFFYGSMALFLSANALIDRVDGGNNIDTAEIAGAITLTTSSDLTRMTNVEQVTARSQSAAALSHGITVNSNALLGGVTTIDLSGDTRSSSTASIDFTGVTTPMTLKGVGAGLNTIKGGSGADALTGGSGNDIFIFDTAAAAAADTVTGGGGSDTVLFRSTEGGTLVVGNKFSAGLSYLITTDSVATANGTTAENINASTHTLGGLTLNGNAGDNILTGSSGADTLAGRGGNDTVRGGASGDTLTTAATGTTTYVFEATASANGLDTVTGLRTGVKFDFTAFLGAAGSVNATAADATIDAVSLDLTSHNIGVRYATSSLSTTNILTSRDDGVAGDVVVADNGKAVIFSYASGSPFSTSGAAIYYVEDTDSDVGATSFSVFLVGITSGSVSSTQMASGDFFV
ncbi:MAG: hypothetical protein V4669_01525 [Pseudomonadota bacterium]